MPRFYLETNAELKEIPENFPITCVQNLSKLSGKPEMFCVASVQANQDMFYGDSNQPCGIANVSSIGGLGVEENKRYCKIFYKLVEEYIGIPRERLRLTFTENLPEYVAFKGKSFYDIVMCRAPGTPIMHSPDE